MLQSKALGGGGGGGDSLAINKKVDNYAYVGFLKND